LLPKTCLNEYRFSGRSTLGAACSALVGRAGDRGWTRTTTIASHLIIIAAFRLAAWADLSADGASLLPLALMASGGWPMICATGAGFGIAALVVDGIGRSV